MLFEKDKQLKQLKQVIEEKKCLWPWIFELHQKQLH